MDIIDSQLLDLKKIANKALNNNNFEKSLAAISAAASLQYSYNQNYIDEELEKMLLIVKEKLFLNREISFNKHEVDEGTVLFYDGFGLDTRGLALIYLKGLANNGYRIIYVTSKNADGNQPEIMKALVSYDVEYCYIDMKKSHVYWISQLCNLFDKYKPKTAFFYTTPFDVAATITFERYDNIVKRYQIDLTDHAFWLGKYAFDYCVELRNVGSQISYNYRKIPYEKIIMLPYYAPINEKIKFEGFPFTDYEGKKIIFSGGALYKTLGDSEKKYYKIVDRILYKHRDVLFLYAGTGDDSELKKIMNKYPKRVFHINERKDLFQIMKRCTFYLNTYPMFGGLMMNFAALAGKVPLTLRHNNDADGLLFNQDKLGIEFDNIEDLLEEADRLLCNEKYAKEKSKKLINSVITCKKFENNLKQLIENQTTEFEIDINNIDTSEFRKEYIKRFNFKESLTSSIAQRCNKSLIINYPILFCKMFLKSLF